MKQEGYVNKSGQPIVHKKIDPKKAGIVAGIILLVVVMIIFIVITVQKSQKNKTCNKIEDVYADAAMGYAREKNILPTVETEQITISGDELIQLGRINKSDVMLKENQCRANITIINHKLKDKTEYIKNVELTNCGYCTTSERYGKVKESSKYPGENAIVELVPTFNYYETKEYYSKWTNYYTQDYLAEKKDEKYGIPLLENENLMPKVPDVAHITKIEKEDKNYYRYHDRKWKFYKNNVSYSAYSSVQPNGYAKKDSASLRMTDWTKWSLNYPDTAKYRTIKSSIGHRWYYKKDGKKIYWNSGEYYPEQPAELYTEKEKKANMYSYRDSQWRWYNGKTTRRYSSYSAVAPKGYTYRDDENTTVSNWTSWNENSFKNSSNSYYREEEVQVKSRYRIVYDVYSLLKLNDFVKKDEFVRLTGKPFVEFYNTKNIKVEVEYRYKYRKA